MTSPSDKAEAKRRYPDSILRDGYLARTAFKAGAKWAAERAALAAAGPAAGVGEARDKAEQYSGALRRWLNDPEWKPRREDIEAAANHLQSIADALAASPPPPVPDGLRIVETIARAAVDWNAANHGEVDEPFQNLIAACSHEDGRPITQDEITAWLAASLPPAAAGVEREMVTEALKAASEHIDLWRYEVADENYERIRSIIDRALASESGPAEGER